MGDGRSPAQLADLAPPAGWHVECSMGSHLTTGGTTTTKDRPMPNSTASTPSHDAAFASIDPTQLEQVAGGAARGSSAGGSSELTAMLTQITSSIKDLSSQNSNSGSDPMQMMLMMMMMGGMGGGGGGVVAAAPAAQPVINVDTSVAGGGRICMPKRGKKGW